MSTETQTETVADRLECEIRRHMACVTPDRGFDSRRMRDLDIEAIDAMLDQHHDLTHGR